MLINFFIFIFKKISNEILKNDISYIVAVFTINCVEYLSVLMSFRLVIGSWLFIFSRWFFYLSWSYDKTYDARCSLCAILM